MSLFRLDASIRVEGSHSREIADIVEQEWRTAHPHSQVVTRHIGVDPIPATAWSTAVNATYVPEGHRSPEQLEAVNLAAEAADQLIDAAALLFAVPLYNFGVSQHFKTWVDLVICDPRMTAGVEPAIAGLLPMVATPAPPTTTTVTRHQEVSLVHVERGNSAVVARAMISWLVWACTPGLSSCRAAIIAIATASDLTGRKRLSGPNITRAAIGPIAFAIP